MLKQEELAFLKVISAVRQSPAHFRELRKALAARKEKGTLSHRGQVHLSVFLPVGSMWLKEK
jgi:hypothetical protein